MPFFKSSVTSRKLTVCLFTSIVIFRPFLLKMVQSFFLIRSVCVGVALETPRPSSLYRPKSHGSRNSPFIRYSRYALYIYIYIYIYITNCRQYCFGLLGLIIIFLSTKERSFRENLKKRIIFRSNAINKMGAKTFRRVATFLVKVE